MPEVNVSEALKAANQFQQAIAQLAARGEELQAEVRELEERNALLYRAPLKKEEVKAFMLDSVDQMASQFISSAGWATLVKRFAFPEGDRWPNGGPLNHESHSGRAQHADAISLQDLKKVGPGSGVNGLVALLGTDHEKLNFLGDGSTAAPLDGRAMCFFFGDLVKAKIERHFDRLCPELKSSQPWRRGEVLSIEQRQAEIASNAARIQALLSEREDVTAKLEELRAAGVAEKRRFFGGAPA